MTPTIPETMRAAVLRDVADGMKVETIRTPRPRTGEVLVKVSACGMCHSDLHVISGAIAFPTPCVLGHEVAGEVVEIGPHNEHSGLAVGDRVAGGFLMPCGQCESCAAGRDDLCEPFFSLNRLKGRLYDDTTRLFDLDDNPIWMYSMGGLAEYCVIPSTSVAKLPDDVDPVAGAHRIIAIDVADDKLAAAVELGATDTVNSAKVNAREAVMELTSGRGVDVAFEVLGRPQTWLTALDVLRDGGRMVPIGLGAGVQKAEVEINRTVRRSQSIIGSYGARTRRDLPEVVRMAAAGVIDYRHIVSRRYGLDEVAAGYQQLHDGQITGRAVVDMSL